MGGSMAKQPAKTETVPGARCAGCKKCGWLDVCTGCRIPVCSNCITASASCRRCGKTYDSGQFPMTRFTLLNVIAYLKNREPTRHIHFGMKASTAYRNTNDLAVVCAPRATITVGRLQTTFEKLLYTTFYTSDLSFTIGNDSELYLLSGLHDRRGTKLTRGILNRIINGYSLSRPRKRHT